MARRIYRFLLVCFCASQALAADTLYQGGDSLNSFNSLVSKNGLFTLGFTILGSAESSASYLGIWYDSNRSHPFWLANRDKTIADNSGVLALDGSGNMKLTYSGGSLNYSFINVSNADEDYLMFTVSGKQFTPQDPRIFSMWQMTYDGNIVDNFTKLEYGGTSCKGNNTDAGCEIWSGPDCRSSRNSAFELRTGYFAPTVPKKSDYNSSLSISDCKDICWKDCQCSGVPTLINTANNTGCMFYYGNFTPDLSVGLFAYYIIVQTEPSGQVSSGKWLLIILAPVGFVSMMGLAGLLWYLRRRRLREKYLKLQELLTLDSTNDTPELENDGNKGHNLMVYSAATIMAATNSFSADNKLGQGGFGPVYKVVC
ncbi:hypothetical protein OIU85_002709 [Salix viminalis]|uniref:Bulb-type lectin domain-containing protein n=1 Tax=Salix viminalis TaxID=40686 RepID=A0A9Q0ZZE2_SALVM|nr:hypothetical protein OIU85_002709 [Salix viminalis]